MFKSRPSGGMLGSVGAKIAHASTIPSLGNPDLRTLQELITAEKGVLASVQRLASDVTKSAETLRNWGMGEGDDLGDVLSHSTSLLNHFSTALLQFASYEEQMRTQLKSIRTREENLDEMKRRKRAVDHKADGADKKLAKMGQEHKGRPAQVELLNDLKEEGRRLEIDIVKEEVAIGDYKRRTTREFLALKFAGMVELAEKATIIGDLGKLMIEEIPLHTTSPGRPRALYHGRDKTSELLSEAQRCLDGVRLNIPALPESVPPNANLQPYGQPSYADLPTPGGDINQGTFESTAPRGHGPYNEFGEVERPPAGSGFSTGSLRIGDDGSRIGSSRGGQFHTLPASGGFSTGLPPISLGDHGREDTFSSSIADALARDPHFSGQHDAPTPPPNQPPASSYAPPQGPPPGAYPPPPGPPPGAYAPPQGPHSSGFHQPSDSYFSRELPDTTQPSSPLVPPHVLSGSSPWASAPSSPRISRPLPTHPPDEDEDSSSLAYARDPSPAPISPAKPAGHEPAASAGHDDILSLYGQAARDQAPSPQLPRDPSPARHPEQDHHEIASAATWEISREMETHAMAPYTPPPRQQSMNAPSPPPQHQSHEPNAGSLYSPYGPPSRAPYAPTPPPESTHVPAQSQGQESTYGTPSEYPNPFSAPLPRPPTLPSFPPAPSISTPTSQSPTGTGRTISAGAFRRNVSRSETLDTNSGVTMPPSVSPLSVRKKTLAGEDTSRGPSPSPSAGRPRSPGSPTSPGAPPIYSAIDDEGMSTSASLNAGRGFVGDAKQPPRNE